VSLRLAATWTGDELVTVQLHDGYPGDDGTANKVERPMPYVENAQCPVVWIPKERLVHVPASRKPWWAPWRRKSAHTRWVPGEIRATHATVWLDGEPIVLYTFDLEMIALGGKFTITMPSKLVGYHIAPTVT
jgi:hypothetical protein